MPSRPISPHIGVYKIMYTTTLSILHRITGIVSTVGLLAFVWWLMALASGHDAYDGAMRLLSSPLAKLLLVGFAFSFVYHFCNGLRHLMWDTGRGLERAQARTSGAVVVVASLIITAAVVWFGCQAMGYTGMGATEIGR